MLTAVGLFSVQRVLESGIYGACGLVIVRQWELYFDAA
jgi:hypothetical protein